MLKIQMFDFLLLIGVIETVVLPNFTFTYGISFTEVLFLIGYGNYNCCFNLRSFFRRLFVYCEL
jgi:hypothetical protein